VTSAPYGSHGCGHVFVTYDDRALLRLPIPATSLQPVRQDTVTKLTLEAIADLVALAGESEDACRSSPRTSGHASPRRCAAPSSTTSPPSSGR